VYLNNNIFVKREAIKSVPNSNFILLQNKKKAQLKLQEIRNLSTESKGNIFNILNYYFLLLFKVETSFNKFYK